MIEALKQLPIQLPSILYSPGHAVVRRAMIRVSGADTIKFINGLSSNAVSTIAPASGQYNLFLNPQGRMLFDSFVWRPDDSTTDLLIDVDHRVGQDLYYHLKQFQLRSKLSVEDVSGKFGCSVHWGYAPSADGAAQLVDPRGSLGLIRQLQNSSLPFSNESEYKTLRFAFGIPEGPEEIPRTQAIPPEYNLDILGGVSYTKGCYLGQELIAKTHHRGTIRKRILPVILSNEPITQRPEFDAELDYSAATQDREIHTSADMEERPVGKLISVHGNLGMALIRLEALGPESSDQTFVIPKHKVLVRPYMPNWLSIKHQ